MSALTLSGPDQITYAEVIVATDKCIPPHQRTQCAECGKDVWKSRTSDRQTCRDCKASIHGRAKYKRGCRCDVCRADKARENREWAAKKRAEGEPRHLYRVKVEQTCAHCGVVFQVRKDLVKSGKGKYCGSDCWNLAQSRGGRRVQRREAVKRRGAVGSVRWRALRRSEKAAIGSTGKGMIWVQGDCPVCGERFVSPGSESRYCSRECRAKNRSSRNFGLTWLDRMALFERDSWTCQICSEPVDYSAHYLSDWYPTLDHIVPRSKGGGDAVENLRTAHRWCNSVRGDLSFYTDADLAA